ncbi:hypothetical protein GO009_01430 [Muricauda sp. TY007]|uniref:hypothetical protein n=1 Tax=Allomuricauda sp. TY007 TaxID=2683200 RepID=UPI0013BFC4DF|nr:hypothetical protein [Muricauda sp. TY007]NDV14672.1 hypothetical protein [Muricauda sp. TY007]
MKFFKQVSLYAKLIATCLLLFSCNKDDDGNTGADSSVTIADGRIAFEVSGYEEASMEGDVVYYLNNIYDIKYFQISDDGGISQDSGIWHIRFEQNSSESIALPEPGEYPIVQGLANTNDLTSFNATISVWTDVMTEAGTTFGGNNGAVNGTLKIVSNTDDTVKGTFSFEAYSSDGQKITVTKGQFAAPKYAW